MDSRKEPLPALDTALEALAGESRRNLGDHPSPERLAAYHEGALPPAEEERLQDHLALCPDCAQLLLDLAGFPGLEPPAGARGLTDGEVDAAWQTMRSRLGGGGEERPAVPALRRLPQPLPRAPISPRLPISPASPMPSRARSATWAWALAASWLVVAGLGYWVVELRRENARLEEPAVNVAIAELTVEGDQVRGGERRSVKISSAAGRSFVDLDAAGLPQHPGYEVEILSSPGPGPTLWTGRELKRSPDDHFTLYLPPGFLSPGSYRLRLFGVENGQRERLADYPFEYRSP